MTFIDTNVFVYAVDARDARKQKIAKSLVYDALLLATAKELGCNRFLTEDLNDGQDYCRVTAVNPF